MTPAEYPRDGILWRGWNDETIRMIAERDHPVLLFVANPDPTVAPFLNAVLREMPLNEKLRELLHDYTVALMVRADAVPEYLKSFGAGTRYNIAVLSPVGLNPLVTIDPVRGKPEEIVETMVKVLLRLRESWEGLPPPEAADDKF